MLLASYNIQFGRGRDGQFDLARIAGELAAADLIALQEVERYWQRSGMVDQPAELARLLHMPHWVYGPGVDLHLQAAPGGAAAGTRRQFGNMLLARTPLLFARNHLLPKFASTGPLSLQRCALEAAVMTAAGAIRVYSVHLTHLSAQTRAPQVQRLLQIHRDACLEGSPIACGAMSQEWVDEALPLPMPRDAVIMGDFNMEPDSAEYAAMVGPISPYGGRLNNPEGLVDTWVSNGHREGDGVTATVHGRPARLDYCFASTALAARVLAARIDADAQGSDHQPIWVEMEL
jgi:endonuclease/exonuclease/phosphatase family metal-dependent hydrolase